MTKGWVTNDHEIKISDRNVVINDERRIDRCGQFKGLRFWGLITNRLVKAGLFFS